MDWKPLGNQTELRLITWITLLQLTRGFVVKLYKAPNLDVKIGNIFTFLLCAKDSPYKLCELDIAMVDIACLTSRRDQTPA